MGKGKGKGKAMSVSTGHVRYGPEIVAMQAMVELRPTGLI